MYCIFFSLLLYSTSIAADLNLIQLNFKWLNTYWTQWTHLHNPEVIQWRYFVVVAVLFANTRRPIHKMIFMIKKNLASVVFGCGKHHTLFWLQTVSNKLLCGFKQSIFVFPICSVAQRMTYRIFFVFASGASARCCCQWLWFILHVAYPLPPLSPRHNIRLWWLCICLHIYRVCWALYSNYMPLMDSIEWQIWENQHGSNENDNKLDHKT